MTAAGAWAKKARLGFFAGAGTASMAAQLATRCRIKQKRRWVRRPTSGRTVYAYVGGNPISLVDPLGLAGCYVSWPGYPITIPGTSRSVPLVHAGVLSYDSAGSTRYYEYGRYGGDFGSVRRQTVPDLKMGPDGKPTPESWDKLMKALDKFGKGQKTKTSCDDKADASKINAFAEQRMNDPNRAPYSWNPLSPNTCTTFARDALGAGQ